MPITHSTFKPKKWLRNGHMQTLLAKFWPRRIELKTTRERLELPDGDFIDCDWVGLNNSGPIVIVLHGLEGSIHSHYASGILQALEQSGYRSVLMHFRGCSEEINRLPRAYHSGDVHDLAALITHIKNKDANTPIFAIGYSLGGNVLLKWLGEQVHTSGLDAAVAISVPYKLAPCVASMDLGFLKIYQQRFVRQLKLKIAQKISTHQLVHLQQHLEKIKTLHDFDDKFTAPIHGFLNAHDYYTKSSCYPYLKYIQVPTLLLQAKDDPLIPLAVLPHAADLSPEVMLELSDHGGHVGFIDLSFNQKINFFLETRIIDFLNTMGLRAPVAISNTNLD